MTAPGAGPDGRNAGPRTENVRSSKETAIPEKTIPGRSRREGEAAWQGRF